MHTQSKHGAAGLLIALTTSLFATVASAHWPPQTIATVDIYDRTDGTSLATYAKDGQRYIIGTPGHEYAIRIRNNTGERILAVTSVDGVNVISGETASPQQSGYVIDAYGSVEIAGWRKSLERTAAFYFTDLGDSYAARTGRPRDVGVVGVAVFKERQPIFHRPFREKIAQDNASERADAPTAAAAAPEAKLGTGHGRSETSYAQQVRFERATDSPAEAITIQYDRRENLIAMGVLPSPRYAQRAPNPFPAMRFAPDPR